MLIESRNYMLQKRKGKGTEWVREGKERGEGEGKGRGKGKRPCKT